MAKSDGTVYIDTLMDTKGFSKGIKSAESKLGNLRASIGKLGGAIAAAFAVKEIIKFGKEAIELGSDLQEVQNVVDVTFTSMSEQVNEFAKNAAQAAGLSQTMAKRYVGTFGAMAKAFGYSEAQAYNMATALTQLTGDVASFYNISQDEAYTKLKSVFTGETESLKELGVVMTQTALDSFAMANGYGKTTKQMSEMEKVALRHAFVISQLSSAQGDFVRTSDSWANQTKILSLNFDSFKANIGQALITIFTPFLQVLNQIVAKMSELSSSFLSFVSLITGRGASGGGSPGAALGGITEGYDDVTDATNKAAKAQKNYTNGLDELNILSEDAGGTAIGTGTIEPIIPEEMQTDNTVLENTNTIFSEMLVLLDNVKNRLKEIINLFKNGLFDGIGNLEGRLNPFKAAFNTIKESLRTIFDIDFVNSFNGLIDTLAGSLGQIVGGFTSIGLSIGENIIGGLANYLFTDNQRIKDYLLSMFDITEDIFALSGSFVDAIAYVFEAIASGTGKKLTSNIIGIIAEAFMGVVELAGNLFLDITSMITMPFINAKESIRKAVEDLLSGLSSISGFLKNLISDLRDFVMSFYEGVISPIFDSVTQRLTELIENNFAPFFSQIGEFLHALGDSLLILWESVLSPLIEWIIKNVAPVIVPIIDTIIGAIKIAIAFITDIITSFLKILTGLINFVTGVFTLNWKKAWEGIKDIFKGIVNSIASLIENFINNAINIINGLISGINEITGTLEIPSIPLIPELKIPKLAMGAVIPPNAPFVAMLGDQKNGRNLEAPEDLIRQIVREEAGLNAEVVALLTEIVRNTRETADKDFGVSIDSRELVSAYDERKARNGYAF